MDGILPQNKVRILCLHGKGTNADIFASQTRSIRQRLQHLCDFVFVDGLFPCDPYPGTEQFYRGPYYSWYEASSSESLRKADGHIRALMTSLGPFDGVMGFSQGGALAAFACVRSATNAGLPAFKFGIFMCCGLPAGVEDMNEDLMGRDMNSLFPMQFATGREIGLESNSSSSTPSSTSGNSRRSSSEDGSPFTSGYTTPPAPGTTLLNIPTAHIVGRHDSILPRSNELYSLSMPSARVRYEHIAGHSLPRTSLSTMGIVRTITQTIHQAIGAKEAVDAYSASLSQHEFEW